MKLLLILRHAKSSWDDGTLDDHERPLNARGKRDAPRVGKLLREENWLPQLVLCSTAVRARKTWSRVAKAAGYDGPVVKQGQLYLAAPSAYLDCLRSVRDDVEQALVVGHNPGLEQLLFQLTGADEPLPTAALAVVELPIDSCDLSDATHGKLRALYRPKELDDGEG